MTSSSPVVSLGCAGLLLIACGDPDGSEPGSTDTGGAAGGLGFGGSAGVLTTGGVGAVARGGSSGGLAGAGMGGTLGRGGSSGSAGRSPGGQPGSGGAMEPGRGGMDSGAGGGDPSAGGADVDAGPGAGGSGSCDRSPPPSSVAAWIDESWAAEGRNNILNRSAWLFDAAMKGDGEINICVRWGATAPATATIRDQIAPAMEQWFNQWFAALYPYDCFPYENVSVNLTGWAVRPGQESLIEWSDDSVPIYTEQESRSDPPGEPKCPDSCGFFFNWDHDFSECPGGEERHFDYSLWLDDSLPGGGAAAVGGDWGLRMPLSGFRNALGNPSSNVILHEIGHGFGLSDYYTWSGSRPEGGSLMIVGSAFGGGPTLGDQWILRRYWSEAREDRY